MSLKIVFTPFKFGDSFSVKDTIPNLMKSFVIYKFLCSGYNACYIGETRIGEHLEKGKKSHIFEHLNENHDFKSLSTLDCFDCAASSKFKLKLKEAMRITWTKPSWTRQLKHMSLSATLNCFALCLLLPFISFITFLLLLVYN